MIYSIMRTLKALDQESSLSDVHVVSLLKWSLEGHYVYYIGNK